ncbi:MAG: DMT family transporter [Actinobacteria bacterium]|nr:DMT family transporter [Actinomycetota bacterium]
MSRRGLLLFAAMCVVWGIPYLLIRVAVRELSPAMLVFARTAVAALLLVPVAAARGELRPVLARWRPVLVFAAVEIAGPWLLLSSAERRISSSLAALLIAAVPLVGAFLAAVEGRERFDRNRVAGIVVGTAGVAAIVGFDVGSSSGSGIAETAGVVVGYAVGPWILARYMQGLPSLGVIAASLVVTTVAYAPVAALQWPASVPAAKVLASVAGLAVVCTAVAFVLFFELIAEVGPVRATVITYVNPAVAAVLGIAVLGERFTAGMAAGFVLVLAGSWLATRAARQPLVAEV